MILEFYTEPDANHKDMAFIEQSVYAFNFKSVPGVPFHPINIFLRDNDQQIHGGIVGGCWGGWFYLAFLWVEEALRSHGYGTQLLLQAEAEARVLGCHSAYLETHSFQAPEFYKRHQYEVVAELPEYPQGYSFFIMKKQLRDCNENYPLSRVTY